MTVDRAVRAVAGTVVLTGLVLGRFVHPGFFFISAFAGVNLLQSAFTGFCPAEAIVKRLGAKAPAVTLTN